MTSYTRRSGGPRRSREDPGNTLGRSLAGGPIAGAWREIRPRRPIQPLAGGQGPRLLRRHWRWMGRGTACTSHTQLLQCAAWALYLMVSKPPPCNTKARLKSWRASAYSPAPHPLMVSGSGPSLLGASPVLYAFHGAAAGSRCYLAFPRMSPVSARSDGWRGCRLLGLGLRRGG